MRLRLLALAPAALAAALLAGGAGGCASGRGPSAPPAPPRSTGVTPAAQPTSAPSATGAGSATRQLPRRVPGPLSAREMELARIAWKYFENNYQAATGFVNAADKYPSTTMWDMGSSLAATVSAFELGLIAPEEFDRRVTAALTSLGKIALFRGQMPNKAYNASNLVLSTYTNQPGEIGVSAIDIGRMLIWLKIIRERYPKYADLADAAVLRWNFCTILDEWGTMFGSAVTPQKTIQYLQEGRLGYEEYAAKGFELWGFDATRALKPEPFEYAHIFGFEIPYDKRDPRELGAHNYVVSESYVLDGIEFNWDMAGDVTSPDTQHTDEFLAAHADRIFLVQKARHAQTGVLTARTEHQLDESPYFVYDTIYTSGFAWNTITEAGQVVPKYSAVAAKAAVGLWALWDDPYSDLLMDRVMRLVDKDRGIFEGDYEDGRGPIKTFTANNNGIILETLLYRKTGKLLPNLRRQGRWEAALPVTCDEACRPRRRPGAMP